MQTSRIAAWLALIVILAACASPAATSTDTTDADDGGAATPTADADDGGGDASGYDLCDAISEDEVSEATGAAVTETTTANLNGVLSCNYLSADAAIAGTTLATAEAGVDPQTIFDANAGAEGAEDIPDLGDDAVLVGDEDFPILMVMVNGNVYSLSVLADNLDGPGKREATIELARLSVDRLP
jgi:Protein of unknown function (DUF3558)